MYGPLLVIMPSETWPSNVMIAGPIPILIGDMVTGAISASYGGCVAAILGDWKPVALDEWALSAPFPPPNALADIDTNLWIADSIPDLGGSGFYYPGDARLTGIRLAAPHRARTFTISKGCWPRKRVKTPNARMKEIHHAAVKLGAARVFSLLVSARAETCRRNLAGKIPATIRVDVGRRTAKRVNERTNHLKAEG